MERSDGSALSADGVLTPPLSTDSSLQELIEAELRTRRATELPQQEGQEQEQEEEEPTPMVVAADLKPSRFVTEQPESIMVLEAGADRASTDDDSDTEATQVTRVTHNTETGEITQTTEVTEQVTERVTEQVTKQVTQQVTQHVPEEEEELPETCIDDDEPQPSADAADEVRPERVDGGDAASESSSQSGRSGKSSRRSSAASDHEERRRQNEEDEEPHQKPQEEQDEQVAVQTAVEGDETSVPPAEEEAVVAAEAAEAAGVELQPERAGDGPEVCGGSSDGQGEQPSRESTPPAEAQSSECDKKREASQESAPPAEAQISECDEKREAQPELEIVKPTPAVTEDVTDDVMVTAPVTDDVIVTAPVSDDGIGEIQSSKVTDEDSDEGVGGGTDRREDAKDAKKLRRKKKSDAEKEAGRRRSSFGKEEAADHTRIHVRSFDSSKAIRRFSKDGPEAASSECRSCGRRVFQMESVHAEGAVWHKNCFRCSQCNKPLTVDTYASHEGKLYCVVHHRQLMKPRAPAAAAPATAAPAAAPAPAATEPGTQSAAPDMVGAEEQPDSPPPADIVRASNKADYGLDDLQNLNVKDRFSVFERTNDDDQEKTPTSVEVKRSQSILDKMKKFQGRSAAPDADSTDDSDGSGDEGRGPRDPDTVRSSTKKERPMSFSGLGDVKSRFEGGGRSVPAPDPAKGELAKMRGMICGAREHKLAYEEALKEQEALSESRRSVEDPSLVVQGNLRQTYERAVQEAGSPRPSSREEAVVRGRAADMASRFERGHLETENGHGATQNGTATSHELTTSGEDSLPSDVGSGEPARADSTDNGPAAPEPAAADTELLHSDTTKRMLNKFKQMEQSSGHADEEMSPNREQAQGNARQMLSKFRQLQEQAQKEDLPDGPRPLKSFTPPPEEPVASELEDATEDNEDAEDPDIVRASSKVHDEFLGKRTDQARSLRDKFESWAPPAERGFTVEDDCKPSLEITRNLRAKFESMKEQPKAAEKPTQHRASKFIMEPSQAAETCGACNKRVYAMERLEVDKRILHKNCFRCSKCNCVLRMDTYTFNAGKLFCTPHFKQMFKTKGNYDEGFGLESRTKHWSSANNHSDHSSLNGTTSAAPRPADATDETNGSASVDSRDTNGASPEPELEQEQEQESSQSHQEQEPASDDERVAVPKPEPEHESEPEPEPVHEPEPERGADVFQQVYESTVAGGL